MILHRAIMFVNNKLMINDKNIAIVDNYAKITNDTVFSDFRIFSELFPAFLMVWLREV